MSHRYNLPNIRTLLTKGFTAEKLRRLCYDLPEFRPVYDRLADETGRDVIIDRLLEHSEQQLIMHKLLAEIQRRNPARFAEHGPYIHGEQLETEIDQARQALDNTARSVRGVLSEEQVEAMLAPLQQKLKELAGELAGAYQLLEQSGAVNAEGDIQARDIVTGIQINIHQGGPPGPDIRPLREAYLNRILEGSGSLTLTGIDPKTASGSESEARLNLSAVYTALLTLTPEAYERMMLGEKPDREDRRLSALAQLNRHKRLVLLGDPGSGKSTFVNFAAICLAGERLGHPQINLELLTSPLPDEEGEDQKERQPWEHGELLPVPVILRDFAARGLPPVGERGTAGHLWRFIEAELEAATLGNYAEHLQRELQEAGGLLLLDGLDEVPEADRRRVQLRQVVTDFARSYPRCRVLVTGRVYAYQKQDWRLPGFAEATLAPFGAGQIIRFVDRWYGHVAALGRFDAENAQGRAALLKRAILGSNRLRSLAERPLLLTLMASLHAWRGGSLPENREELYADTVDLLLDVWESPKVVKDERGEIKFRHPGLAEMLQVGRERVRTLLNRLAYEVHTTQPELVGTADVAEGELVAGLMRLTRQTEAEVNPVRLVNYLRDRAGLLVPRGVGVYTFPHRTFQEYLAACHLTDTDFPDRVAELARSDPNRWREAALLAGAKAARGTSFAIWSLVEALCFREVEAEEQSLADLWGALLAGQALAEVADLDEVSERNRIKLERVRAWLARVVIRSDRLPATERAAAGDTLARLGDPRPAVTTVDGMEFCYVPPGPFWMGSPDEDEMADEDREKPLHQFDIPYGYWLARYPVTVAQWREFVEKSGHKPGFERSLREPLNRPVVAVTWYDGLAFCEWLTEKWRGDGLLPSDWRVILPSEAEWEKAARGGLEVPPSGEAILRSVQAGLVEPELRLSENDQPQRRYPWGDEPDTERANYVATRLGTTSAVGCFPGGTGPYGAEEMSGNVWEWTRSLFEDYPYDPGDGRENLQSKGDRTLRGGSWTTIQRDARVSSRDPTPPGDFINFIGLRLVVAPV